MATVFHRLSYLPRPHRERGQTVYPSESERSTPEVLCASCAAKWLDAADRAQAWSVRDEHVTEPGIACQHCGDFS